MAKSQLRKIVILGTTGSGKTTFLKNLVGDFSDAAEVERRVVIEEAQVINTFTPVDSDLFKDSTTTVSMNVKNVLFLTTRTNQFHFMPLNSKDLPVEMDQLDSMYPTIIVDTAGQERFAFMQDIGIKGADGVIIFADGTNIQSIERVAHFQEMIKQEATRSGKKIPIVVFVNKSDLQNKGVYIGAQKVKEWISDIQIYETTNTDMETFNLAIRNFLNTIEGFPVDISQITIKKVHEVY